MRKSLMFAGAVLALLSGEFASGFTCAQAAPATWSLERASLGFDGKLLLTDNGSGQVSQFAPGMYVSYSLASNLSLAGTLERSIADHLTIAKAGARVRVLDTDRGDIAGGVDLVSYSDEGAQDFAKATSYSLGVHGAWDAIRAKNGRTSVWAIASVSYDPDNNLTMYRAGLRWQAIGGKPFREPEPLP